MVFDCQMQPVNLGSFLNDGLIQILPSFGAVTILSWHYSCVTMVLLARLATRLDAMIAGGYATQHYSILVLVLVLVLALVLVLVLALPRCRADCSDC